jgi:hypothetical protein
VPFHTIESDSQSLSDVGIGQAPGNQSDDILLALGEFDALGGI